MAYPDKKISVNTDLLTSSYDYDLPESRIAKYPVSPRDSAKLLVYDRISDTIVHTSFKEFLNYLPGSCTVFLNDTMVIKARIFGKKKSGGKIELLLDKPLENNRFLVMIRGKVHKGSILNFDGDLSAEILSLETDGTRIVKFSRKGQTVNFSDLINILEKIGHVPLPPYMRRESTENDSREYQTVFARKAGAVAAPTASLHFTDELLEKMKKSREVHTLTLHVGAGTFKPVENKNILDHPMHSEYFTIPEKSAEVLRSNGKILAVGTTVTRTIEYFHRTGAKEGECDIFLHPGNPPARVDMLLTNFHLPKSTLIMLVSAFIGREKTLRLYKEAIDKKYRFYSYGDAMLIL